MVGYISIYGFCGTKHVPYYYVIYARHLVFGHDMILNTPLIVDWEAIRKFRGKLIDKNNQIENKNSKPHRYRIRDKVLVRNKKSNKYKEPYVGPYPITQVWTNKIFTIFWAPYKSI